MTLGFPVWRHTTTANENIIKLSNEQSHLSTLSRLLLAIFCMVIIKKENFSYFLLLFIYRLFNFSFQLNSSLLCCSSMSNFPTIARCPVDQYSVMPTLSSDSLTERRERLRVKWLNSLLYTLTTELTDWWWQMCFTFFSSKLVSEDSGFYTLHLD